MHVQAAGNRVLALHVVAEEAYGPRTKCLALSPLDPRPSTLHG